jgi:hypothetical protein
MLKPSEGKALQLLSSPGNLCFTFSKARNVWSIFVSIVSNSPSKRRPEERVLKLIKIRVLMEIYAQRGLKLMRDVAHRILPGIYIGRIFLITEALPDDQL